MEHIDCVPLLLSGKPLVNPTLKLGCTLFFRENFRKFRKKILQKNFSKFFKIFERRIGSMRSTPTWNTPHLF